MNGVPRVPLITTLPSVANVTPYSVNGAKERRKEKYIDRNLTQSEVDFLRRTSTINGTDYLPWMEEDAFDFNDKAVFNDPFDYHVAEKHLKRGCYFEYPSNMFGNPGSDQGQPGSLLCAAGARMLFSSSTEPCSGLHHRLVHHFLRQSRGPLPPTAHHRNHLSPAERRPRLQPQGQVHCETRLQRHSAPSHHRSSHSRDLPEAAAVHLLDKIGELWPILIEKAFLKVHGGYSYDGGNAGRTPTASPGWIPENLLLDDLSDDEASHRWDRTCRRSSKCGWAW